MHEHLPGILHHDIDRLVQDCMWAEQKKPGEEGIARI